MATISYNLSRLLPRSSCIYPFLGNSLYNRSFGRCSSRTLCSSSPDASNEEAKLQEQMKAAEQKFEEEKGKLLADVEEYKDKYKRALAEAENVRRRMQKQISDAKQFGVQGFCKDLLEVADILSTATQSVPKDVLSASDCSPHLKGMHEGLVMTETQLQKTFDKHGLVQIAPAVGEKFDPNQHEAMFVMPLPEDTSADAKPGDVAALTKIGYKLHERTLRPALVGVFKG